MSLTIDGSNGDLGKKGCQKNKHVECVLQCETSQFAILEDGKIDQSTHWARVGQGGPGCLPIKIHTCEELSPVTSPRELPRVAPKENMKKTGGSLSNKQT